MQADIKTDLLLKDHANLFKDVELQGCDTCIQFGKE